MYLKEVKGLVIECESFSNRSNWGHRAYAYYNSREVANIKAIYYNRTWERYQYESVMLALVHKLDEAKVVPLASRMAMYNLIKISTH